MITRVEALIMDPNFLYDMELRKLIEKNDTIFLKLLADLQIDSTELSKAIENKYDLILNFTTSATDLVAKFEPKTKFVIDDLIPVIVHNISFNEEKIHKIKNALNKFNEHYFIEEERYGEHDYSLATLLRIMDERLRPLDQGEIKLSEKEQKIDLALKSETGAESSTEPSVLTSGREVFHAYIDALIGIHNMLLEIDKFLETQYKLFYEELKKLFDQQRKEIEKTGIPNFPEYFIAFQEFIDKENKSNLSAQELYKQAARAFAIHLVQTNKLDINYFPIRQLLQQCAQVQKLKQVLCDTQQDPIERLKSAKKILDHQDMAILTNQERKIGKMFQRNLGKKLIAFCREIIDKIFKKLKMDAKPTIYEKR